MVKKIALLVIGIIAVLLIVAAFRITRRCGDNDRITTGKASAVGTAMPSQKEPLAEDEVQKCFLAFEEIGDAYSNLQSDAMQKHFCAISNKVVRLGKERLAEVLSPFEASFGARFCHSDIKTLKFSSVSEFDRFIKANIEAANIIGYSKIMSGIYSDDLCVYDMVVFYKRSSRKRTLTSLRRPHRCTLTRGESIWHLGEVLRECIWG